MLRRIFLETKTYIFSGFVVFGSGKLLPLSDYKGFCKPFPEKMISIFPHVEFDPLLQSDPAFSISVFDANTLKGALCMLKNAIVSIGIDLYLSRTYECLVRDGDKVKKSSRFLKVF